MESLFAGEGVGVQILSSRVGVTSVFGAGSFSGKAASSAEREAILVVPLVLPSLLGV